MPPREVRPPVCRDGWCQCPCHDWLEGTEAEQAHAAGESRRRARINGLGATLVKVESALEAAIACTECRKFHTIAMSGRPSEIDEPGRAYNPPPMNAALPDEQYDGA